MATDVDVQYFSHLNGLVLGNNWGDLIRLLDKALVTGVNFTQITAASIDAQGDVHITLFAAHNAMLFQIVELTGFSPAAINGKYRIKGTPTTAQLVLKAEHAGKTISTVGTAKLASLGYEIIFRDANDVKRVYRAKNPRSEHPFIRVDESISDGVNSYNSEYAKYAMVGLIENMTHIDDYQDSSKLQLPLDTADFSKNWKITGTGTNVVRGWSRWHYARIVETYNSGNDATTPANGARYFSLCGDQDAFYMFTTVTPTQTSAKQLLGCGLYNAAIESGVIPNWFLFAPTHLNNASYTLDHTAISGGWPLFYQLESSKLLTSAYKPLDRIKNHVLSTPILPDYRSGRSGLFNGAPVAALEIPFYDSDAVLGGSLKGIFYAGDVRNTNVQTTPILTGNSMYIYDGTPNSNNTGGCYFYLGELE